MILAVNANAALDIILFIDRFRPGETMRPGRVVTGVGGKGLDAALVLRELGAAVQAVSFIAGRNGETLADLLMEKQIPVDFIPVPGETRVAHVIAETELNRHSHITTPGYTVSAQACEVFKQHVIQYASQADWAIVAGSLPEGAPVSFYREIVALLHQHQVQVLMDCAGQPALEALSAAPDIVKMNQDEFSQTFQTRPDSSAGWVGFIRKVMQDLALQNFVLTRGKEGLLALTPHASYQASAPLQQAVNAAGSGDAASAALAYRLSLGDSWETALRWAAAAGAAVVLTEGTAECHLADVERLYTQTVVHTLEPREHGG